MKCHRLVCCRRESSDGSGSRKPGGCDDKDEADLSDVSVLKRRSVCSFALIFVVASLVQLGASVLIWYLGYVNSRNSVGTLSDSFREELIQGATDQVTNILNQPVAAMNRMDYTIQRQYRGLCN